MATLDDHCIVFHAESQSTILFDPDIRNPADVPITTLFIELGVVDHQSQRIFPLFVSLSHSTLFAFITTS